MKQKRLSYLLHKITIPGFDSHVPLLTFAVIIGIAGGLGAVLFRWVIKVVQVFFYGYKKGHHADIFKNFDWIEELLIEEAPAALSFLKATSWWWTILIPAAGGLIVGIMIYLGAREAKGHGVPEVMEAVALRGGLIKTRVGLIKTIASAITIGSGGSAGQEGPIVQIGASIGSTVGQWFRVSQMQQKTLVGCGAAAGIAATFNAPIAGVIFSMEVILGDFKINSFSPLVVSSVLATAISRMFFGDAPAFVVPSYEMVSNWELAIYPVLGIFCGLLSAFFVWFLYFSEDFFEQKIQMPEYLKPMLGGALVGIVIIKFPQVFGVGYESLTEVFKISASILNRGDMVEMTWKVVLALIAIKMIATALTIGSGGSGGVFAPSLYIGAMVGGFFGYIVHYFFPEASPGAYALVATGALVAGTTYAPITAVLIIFELSGDYKIILPLMMCCIISVVVSSSIKKGSIYTTKLLRKGIDIEGGVEQNVLRNFKVKNFMSKNIATIAADSPIGEVVKAFENKQASYIYLTNEDNHLVGYVSFRDIRMILDEQKIVPLGTAADIAIANELIAVSPSESIKDARHKMNQQGVTQLPVVSDNDPRILVGSLSDTHVLAAYDKAVLRREISASEAV
ncbi:MAG: chloride channel protein [Gammaproteobacteria bacterium]|nr:MAG: chloride channel protein [Gammaproteobacteria bacterium]